MRAALWIVTMLVAVGLLAAGVAGRRGRAAASGRSPAAPLRPLDDAPVRDDLQAPGALEVVDAEGRPVASCPLRHTDVQVEISGFMSQVTVTQQFRNPYDEKIEAVYTFPLSQNAAVYDMLMKVGGRTIRGEIHPRQVAQQIYQAARDRGHVAALLDQERPNIFTQSVANIMPGEAVDITIRYTEILPYEDGLFRFSFPMVVGPRYIPGSPVSATPEQAPQNQGRVVEVPGPRGGPEPGGTGWAPDTDQVPDASRITPPVTAPGTRAGHDISIQVALDAGAPLQQLESVLHEVEVRRSGTGARIALVDQETIPNQDFILEYSTATDAIGDALLTHADDRGGYFILILQPPRRVVADQAIPKELVFVLDVSGSMSGYPIETAKQTMDHCLASLNPKDTFNLVTFSGNTDILFPRPLPATPENVRTARDFVATRRGSGGTEMMKAIRAALEPSDSQQHVRIVCFMTDGYVGNDMAIIGEIQKHANARVFSFGVGNSVNRFLLDGMAGAGRGEVEYVILGTAGSEVAGRFYERVRHPVLTDIEIDWGGLPVEDVYPRQVRDLFSSRPVVVYGRYTRGASGALRLTGRTAGKPWERSLQATLPAREEGHSILAQLWARAKVDDLMARDWRGLQNRRPSPEIEEQITSLGVEYRLLTQCTSFVAVEEMTITEGGAPRTVAVPVEMPAGVSYQGVFGAEADTVMAGGMPGLVAVMPGGSPRGAMGPTGLSEAPAGFLARRLAEGDAASAVEAEEQVLERLKPEERRAALLRMRLHETLRKVVEEARKRGEGASFTIDTVKVENGRVEVWLWLADVSETMIHQLGKRGVRVLAQSRATKMVIAEAPVKALEEIALLEGVRRIEPAR